MKKNKTPHYVAKLKHDQGKMRLKVFTKSGVSVVVQMILRAEACPKCAIVSITKVYKSGARLKIKHW